MAPGFPYMQTDRMDITFSPRLRILENRVVMSATVGYRKNNLSNTKLQTSSQLLMAMQVNATFTPQAGVNGSFSNFGMRTTHSMDTLRMEMIATSVSLAPGGISKPIMAHTRYQHHFLWIIPKKPTL